MAIQISDLMPGVMHCVKYIASVHPGEEVLILADTTVDLDVIEAYRVGYTAAGARVNVLTFPSRGAGASSGQITDKVLTGLFPKVAVGAMKEADLYINLSGMAELHGLYGTGHSIYGLDPGDLYKKYGTRALSITISNKEALASDWAVYPQDLLMYLGYKGIEAVEKAAKGDPENAVVHITDPQGTDFTFTGFKISSKKSLKNDPFGPMNVHGTKQVGLLPHKPFPNAEGVIVSTSIHTGPVPQVKATLEGGRVVKLEGGGEISMIWPKSWKEGKDCSSIGRKTSFGEHLQPGNNWLEEVMWGVHPRTFRQGIKYLGQGSETFKAWSGGIRRAGVIHFGIGGGMDEFYRHRDLEVFYATMTINGEKIIENGHLLMLDDPEIRTEAAKYGDPDELLTERWFPFSPLAE